MYPLFYTSVLYAVCNDRFEQLSLMQSTLIEERLHYVNSTSGIVIPLETITGSRGIVIVIYTSPNQASHPHQADRDANDVHHSVPNTQHEERQHQGDRYRHTVQQLKCIFRFFAVAFACGKPYINGARDNGQLAVFVLTARFINNDRRGQREHCWVEDPTSFFPFYISRRGCNIVVSFTIDTRVLRSLDSTGATDNDVGKATRTPVRICTLHEIDRNRSSMEFIFKP